MHPLRSNKTHRLSGRIAVHDVSQTLCVDIQAYTWHDPLLSQPQGHISWITASSQWQVFHHLSGPYQAIDTMTKNIASLSYPQLVVIFANNHYLINFNNIQACLQWWNHFFTTENSFWLVKSSNCPITQHLQPLKSNNGEIFIFQQTRVFMDAFMNNKYHPPVHQSHFC